MMAVTCQQAVVDVNFLDSATELQSQAWNKVRSGVATLQMNLSNIMKERDKFKDTIILLNMEKKDLYDRIKSQATEIELLKRKVADQGNLLQIEKRPDPTSSLFHSGVESTASSRENTSVAIIQDNVIVLDDVKSEPHELLLEEEADYEHEPRDQIEQDSLVLDISLRQDAESYSMERSSLVNRISYEPSLDCQPSTSSGSRRQLVCDPGQVPLTNSSGIKASSGLDAKGALCGTNLQCTYCNASFKSWRSLNGHLRTHTGEKPFKCQYCDVSFADQSNLRRHVQVHTGERPYTCQHCGRAFKRKENLKAHQFTKKCIFR